MRRVYINRCDGKEVVHVEFTKDDLPNCLDDIDDFDLWPETCDLVDILKEARDLFENKEDR